MPNSACIPCKSNKHFLCIREYQQLPVHHIGAKIKHIKKIKSTILILQKKKLNKRNTCMHTKF